VTSGARLVGESIDFAKDGVSVVDNFFMGRKENLKHHFGNPRFEPLPNQLLKLSNRLAI